MTGQEREALDLWFCPSCGTLLNNSNYKVDEKQKCRGKRHQTMGVKRRYVLAALIAREEPHGSEQKLREALEGAAEFIERVEGWTGGDSDEADEMLGMIGRALAARDEPRTEPRPVGVGKGPGTQASIAESRFGTGADHKNAGAGSPRLHPEAGVAQNAPGCRVCGGEKILMGPDGSKAQPCYFCQPTETTLEQASRPYAAAARQAVERLNAKREYEPLLVKDLPRRVAEVTFALINSNGPYANGMGPRTTREVMFYDSEALTLSSTFGALSRAMRYGLVARTFRRPVLWFPTNLAIDLRGPLEDHFFLYTQNEEL